MERKQFTFYRSFWEAIKSLPKKDQAPVMKAIISYALDGEIIDDLTPLGKTVFCLVQPTLESGRKKAAAGQQGGSS